MWLEVNLGAGDPGDELDAKPTVRQRIVGQPLPVESERW
jgi:hypothetical protein